MYIFCFKKCIINKIIKCTSLLTAMENIWNDPNFLSVIGQWCGLFILWKRKLNKRRFWIRPINENRSRQGDFAALFQELKDDTIMFFRYTRMTVDTFYVLLEMIAPKLEKQNWRALSPELRLCVTLRYILTRITF